jgi:hypothetical protein
MIPEQAARLERDYEIAAKRLADLAAKSAPIGSRRGAEAVYAQTYQALVQAGLRPQIRGKYRRMG